MKSLSDVQDCESYAGILADDAVLIDIDDYEQSETLMQIVEDKQLLCRVYETSRGKHFFFKNSKVEKVCKSCVACLRVNPLILRVVKRTVTRYEKRTARNAR